MLSIFPVTSSGYGEYLGGSAAENYYAKEESGYWRGEGATSLGLEGKVKDEEIKNLLDGFSKDGSKKLTQNAGSTDRQCGWDLTLNAPKGVSVAWGVADAVSRRRIERAFRNAVAKFIRKVEADLGETRRDKGGRRTEKVALVFAVFVHGMSRAGDPHLHAHVLVINLGLRQDGTTGTILSKPFYHAKMRLGQDFRDTFAKNLERLGLPVERHGGRFDLAGISREVKRHFSQRRSVIERVLEELGFNSPQAARAAALATRSTKPDLTRAELHADWIRRALTLGLEPEAITKLFGQRKDRVHPEASSTAPGQAERVVASAKEEPGRRAPNTAHARLEGTGGLDGEERAKTEAGPDAKRERKDQGRQAGRVHDPGTGSAKGRAEPRHQRASGPSFEDRATDDAFVNDREYAAWRLRFYGRTLFKLPFTRLEVRWIQNRPFWKAPRWSPLSKVRLGMFALAKEGERVWKAKLQARHDIGEPRTVISMPGTPLEVQANETLLFPNAPSWSFARRMTAYRLAFGFAKRRSGVRRARRPYRDGQDRSQEFTGNRSNAEATFRGRTSEENRPPDWSQSKDKDFGQRIPPTLHL